MAGQYCISALRWSLTDQVSVLGQRRQWLPVAARLFETHQRVQLVATADRCLQMVMKDPNAGLGMDAEAEVREARRERPPPRGYATITPPARLRCTRSRWP